VRYGSVGGLEYEVPQKLTHLLQCTHILHNFWTSTHRGEASPNSPLAAPLAVEQTTIKLAPTCYDRQCEIVDVLWQAVPVWDLYQADRRVSSQSVSH